MAKLIKEYCEVCGNKEICTLQLHHIVPRTDINCTNDNINLAIICSNCHLKTHNNVLKIIGVIPSTKKPNNRILIYEVDGIKNIDIEIPETFKIKSYKIGKE